MKRAEEMDPQQGDLESVRTVRHASDMHTAGEVPLVHSNLVNLLLKSNLKISSSIL